MKTVTRDSKTVKNSKKRFDSFFMEFSFGLLGERLTTIV